MNSFNINTKINEKTHIKKSFKNETNKKENYMQNTIDKLINLVEIGGVPDYGDFNKIKADFQNDNKKLNAGKVALSIEPSILLKERPKERELRIKVYSKNNSASYSTTLFRGEKAEILNKLEDDNIKDEIQEFIILSSEKFDEF